VRFLWKQGDEAGDEAPQQGQYDELVRALVAPDFHAARFLVQQLESDTQILSSDGCPQRAAGPATRRLTEARMAGRRR
jgi:hypothetical protein